MDAFGDGAKGDMEGGGRRSCNCSCPSKTDCLRAWGWSSGRLGDLARGAMIREDDVPGTGSRVHDHELKLQAAWQTEYRKDMPTIVTHARYSPFPLPETATRVAGAPGPSDSLSVGRSLGVSVAESERDASSLFLSTSADGGSSKDLEGKLWPMRPLRRVELLAPLLDRGRKTGTTVRGVPGEVGGRDKGTELMECAPRR